MRPLEGIKILDFTHAGAGPFCTMLLADLGCDVIKVEKPDRGDPTRYMNVSETFVTDIPKTGGDYYIGLNRNKRDITLALDTERGRQIALDLVRWADIVTQNFRPGVMQKLGLDYHAVRQVKPDIIYASLSAYGTSGPLAHQPGMDLAVQARTGLMSMTGYPGGDPVRVGVPLADFSGGTHLAVAILSAIVYRQKTGKGQEVHVSLLDATMTMAANYSVAVLDGGTNIEPMGSAHQQLVPYQAFPASDGFIIIATGTNSLYRDLCTTLGMKHLINDPRFKSNVDRLKHREELVALISAKTREKTRAQWLAIFEEKQIPCAPVNDALAAFDDPQLKANGMIAEVDHPTIGKLRLLGVPYKFSESRCEVYRHPPLQGEHTEEVLTSILGMSREEITTLNNQRVV